MGRKEFQTEMCDICTDCESEYGLGTIRLFTFSVT